VSSDGAGASRGTSGERWRGGREREMQKVLTWMLLLPGSRECVCVCVCGERSLRSWQLCEWPAPGNCRSLSAQPCLATLWLCPLGLVMLLGIFIVCIWVHLPAAPGIGDEGL
jgi:hypothetical protein